MTIMKLLRVYTDKTAYFGDRKVIELIAERALDARVGGATVIEAMIGLRHSLRSHSFRCGMWTALLMIEEISM